MHKSIDNTSQFRDEFAAMNRQTQFSYEGLGLLFDYLEEVDPDYSLDVITLCCNFAEDTAGNIAYNYGFDCQGQEDRAICETVINELNDHTSVVGITSSGSIVYAQF